MAENTMALEVCIGQRGDLVGTLWLAIAVVLCSTPALGTDVLAVLTR